MDYKLKLNRIIKILEFYRKKGVNKESVNTIYRKLLSNKFNTKKL